MTAADGIDAIAVVIPAHNEEELLPRCLTAVEIAALAARRQHVRVDVWVALDRCDDATPQIAAAAGVLSIAVDAQNVGVARQAGVDAALRRFDGIPPERTWIAHTDADSTVPPNWLTHQLALAREGADVMIGTVRPNFDDLTEAQRDAWWSTHTPGVANGHVHGANLGMRASTLLAAGGVAPVPLHEDVVLVDAARTIGARVAASDAAWVQTSGRRMGRAPGGYARYLREDLEELARRHAQPRHAHEIAVL